MLFTNNADFMAFSDDAKYYNMNSGITCCEKYQEELTYKDGKKYIVMTITNYGYDEF